MVDVTAWRAYSAEHSLPEHAHFPDFATAKDFAEVVVSSPLWSDLVRHDHEVRVIEAPFEAHESWLERERSFLWRRADLAIHPDMRWELNLLHELAHGAAPHYRYVPGRQGHEWPAHRELHPHGELWVATFLRLVDEFQPGWGSELRDAYRHYGVLLRDDAALDAALEESRRAEEELAAWERGTSDRDQRLWGLMMIDHQQDSTTVTWSRRPSVAQILIDQLRGLGDPRRSVDALFDPVIDMVSPVVPCTAVDLAEVCETRVLPVAEHRLAKIAAAAMIALDVDPIVMRVHLGLTRWNAGLSEDDTQLLGPALVEARA